MLLGVLGGLLGAGFIFVNQYVNSYRKIYLNTKWKRVIEVVILVLVTSTIIYYAPVILYNDCIPEVEK